MPENFHRPRKAPVPRRAIACEIFLICAVALGSAPPARAGADKRSPELAIASEGSRPPYNFLDGNDLAGFEIELGRELCTRMNRSCSFVAQDWDGLVPGLLEHHYDAIMAAMEMTEEAREKLAFSAPYVRMPAALVARNETEIADTSQGSLADKRIGVESDGAPQAYAENFFSRSEILPYATLEEAILDLAEGRLDVVLADKEALGEFLKTRREGQCCRFVGDIPYLSAYFGKGIGIGFRPEDKALAAAFDKALAELRGDGTFDRIRAKYFDFDILASEAAATVPPQARK